MTKSLRSVGCLVDFGPSAAREHVGETVAYMVGVKVSREILSLSKTRDGHLNLVTAIHAGG